MNFLIQWFKGWSEFQKEDFVQILSQRMKDAEDPVNNLVNGITGLETSGRPPSLFRCQVKLFNEWWTTWAPEDREKMQSLFKEADPAFYTSVESGESQKLDEEFMMVPTKSDEKFETTAEATNGDQEPPKSAAPVFNVTKVIINNGPSSFSSIESESVTTNGREDSEGNAEVTVSTNGDCDSAEPVATEI